MDNTNTTQKQLELNSLIEFSQLINSNLNLDFILGNILLSIMGRMMITKGVMLICKPNFSNYFSIASSKGVASIKQGKSLEIDFPKEPFFIFNEVVPPELLKESGLNYFFKIYFLNKFLGVLCLGEKPGSVPLEKNEIIFIETLLNISSTSIENTLKFTEIKSLNVELSSKVSKLNSLFELSKIFNSNFQNKDEIVKLLSYTLLGNYGIRDLIIFSKYRSDNFYILTANDSSQIPEFEYHNYSDISESKILTQDETNPLLKYLYDKNYELIIPVLNSKGSTESLACLGKKLNKTPYKPEDIEFIESIINLSVISIDNTILFLESLEKQAMENELKIARDIQLALLPKVIPEIPGYQISGVNKPALHIGGDYFDILKLNENHFAIVIADVSGKGTPASLLMANIQSAVHSFMKFYEDEHFNLVDVTHKINQLIYENTSPEKFITFFWGILETENNKFIYVNAGHNPPIHLSDNKITTLEKGGLMIGVFESGYDYEFGEVNFKEGDTIALYTDGVTEAINSLEEEFGEENLRKLLLFNQSINTDDMLNLIIDEVNDFSYGMKQYDDQTLIVLKRL